MRYKAIANNLFAILNIFKPKAIAVIKYIWLFWCHCDYVEYFEQVDQHTLYNER